MDWSVIIVAIISGLSVAIPNLVSTYVSNSKRKIEEENKAKIKEQKDEEWRQKIEKHLDDIDKTTCQNFLVEFLTDKEQGKEIDPVKEEHAHKLYDHYKSKGWNSYIHTKWERVMK